MLLAGLLFAGSGSARSAILSGMPLLVLAQIASASAMFVFFFRLQAVGGPVYLSQIGYVGAAVGLIAGTLVLGERYQLLTWVGAAIITVGVFMTTRGTKPEALTRFAVAAQRLRSWLAPDRQIGRRGQRRRQLPASVARRRSSARRSISTHSCWLRA